MKKYSANSSFYSGNELQNLTYSGYNYLDPMMHQSDNPYYNSNYDTNCGYTDYDDYMNEKEMDEDYETMKNMYPETCKRIMKYVEEECNRLDYEGSALYDEMMDKELIEIITERIYERLMDEDDSYDEKDEMDEEDEEQVDMTRAYDDKWKKSMVKVMLLNDIYGRRSRRSYRRGRSCRPMPYRPYNRGCCYPTPYQYPYQNRRYRRY